jgi:hypothetical protein
VEQIRRIAHYTKDLAELAGFAVTLIGLIAYCELRNE